jgi:PKD repeat protein
MKSKFFLPTSVLLVLCVVMYTACTKSEADPQVPEPPQVSHEAAFSAHVIANDGKTVLESESVYRDSSFYFQNRSDSGGTLSYQWDFGDGITSLEKHPAHTYKSTGAYRVLLTIRNGVQAVDTAQKIVKVVLGEQHIAFANGRNLDPIEIIETGPRRYTLLAASGDFANYYLYYLDSLFKITDRKDLGNLMLTSMAPTTDGNFIAAGSNRIAPSERIFKLRPDGSIIWAALTLGSGESYGSVAASPDGGFIAVGSRLSDSASDGFSNTLITKIDANGNKQWEKYFNNERLVETKNVLIDTDGLTIAGSSNGKCTGCDSISIVKLNTTGQLVWQSTVPAGFNTLRRLNRVTKLIDATVAITNPNGNTVFVFSPDGKLLATKVVPHITLGVVSDTDGGMVILQGEVSAQFKIFATKVKADGSVSWDINPNLYIKGRDGNVTCCSNSGAVSITRFSNGQLFFMGTRISEAMDAPTRHHVALLFPLSEGGKPY